MLPRAFKTVSFCFAGLALSFAALRFELVHLISGCDNVRFIGGGRGELSRTSTVQAFLATTAVDLATSPYSRTSSELLDMISGRKIRVRGLLGAGIGA